MKLFNRKKDTSTPDEIKNYYAEERRDRTGVAWLLAAATLIVTLLLALGLFYGGRWVYRAIFDGDDAGSNTVQQEQTIDEFGDDVTNQTTEESETNADNESETNVDNESEDDADGVVIPGNEAEESAENSGTPNSSGDAESSEDDRLPSSGELPATGPTEPEL